MELMVVNRSSSSEMLALRCVVVARFSHEGCRIRTLIDGGSSGGAVPSYAKGTFMSSCRDLSSEMER